MTFWMVAVILNQVLISRVAYNTYKRAGAVNFSGIVFLSFWNLIFAPMFTFIAIFMWIIERIK